MTEQHNTPATENTEAKERQNRGPFASPADAEAAGRPCNPDGTPNPHFKLFAVSLPDGTSAGYWWGRDNRNAVADAAMKAGWKAGVGGASKEKVADLLGKLSEADREALFAEFGAAQQPKGKGK